MNLVTVEQLQIIYMLSPIICAGLATGYYFGIRGTDVDIKEMKEAIRVFQSKI